MGSFLFFPASSITQLKEDVFNLIHIYGGKYYLRRPHIEVYLAQPHKANVRSNRVNFSDSDYGSILESLIEKKIIFRSELKKEFPFNKEKILEAIQKKPTTLPRTLNIGEVTLELIQSCPYSCEGCFREVAREGLTPIQRLERLVSELSEMGLSKISLSGGEITASDRGFERFSQIASYAKSEGIRVRLLTTGYNPDRVENALKYIDEIQISIDGLEETHDSYKGRKGSFERAIESSKRALKNGKVKITTNTVVSMLNYREVPDLIDFLSQFKIDTVRITKMMTPKRKLKLGLKEAIELCLQVREKQEEYPNQKIINAFGDCSDVLNCTGGVVYAHIGATGNVFACDYDVENIAGNINYATFQDIWTNSPIIKDYRRITPIQGECLNCTSRVFCFGNCRIDKEYVAKAGTCKNEN